jgi:hypothetical protein
MDSKLRGHFILRKRELFIPNVAEWLALVFIFIFRRSQLQVLAWRLAILTEVFHGFPQ